MNLISLFARFFCFFSQRRRRRLLKQGVLALTGVSLLLLFSHFLTFLLATKGSLDTISTGVHLAASYVSFCSNFLNPAVYYVFVKSFREFVDDRMKTFRRLEAVAGRTKVHPAHTSKLQLHEQQWREKWWLDVHDFISINCGLLFVTTIVSLVITN